MFNSSRRFGKPLFRVTFLRRALSESNSELDLPDWYQGCLKQIPMADSVKIGKNQRKEIKGGGFFFIVHKLKQHFPTRFYWKATPIAVSGADSTSYGVVNKFFRICVVETITLWENSVVDK
jgi:hypothetical protein